MAEIQLSKRVVIDPSDCRCTECIIGLHTPYFELTAAEVARMLNGDPVSNNTGKDIKFLISITDNYASVVGNHHHEFWVIDRAELEGDLTTYFPAN